MTSYNKFLTVTWTLIFAVFVGLVANLHHANAQAPTQPWHRVSWTAVDKNGRAISEYTNGRYVLICNEYVVDRYIGVYSGDGTSATSCVVEP